MFSSSADVNVDAAIFGLLNSIAGFLFCYWTEQKLLHDPVSELLETFRKKDTLPSVAAH